MPFAPGGNADLTGRLFSEDLSKRLGQQVIVDNRGGAGGAIGAGTGAVIGSVTPVGTIPGLIIGGVGGAVIGAPVVVGRRVESAARLAAVVFGAFFVLSAAWGLFGTIGAGHYGTLTSFGIVAENMIKWRTIGPVWSYTATAPSASEWYCHHPFGTFWTTWLLVRLFGHHDWLLPLPPPP